MSKEHYYPRSRGNRIVWLGNHKVKIGTRGAAVGLTAPQITARQTSCQAIIDAFNATDQLRAQLKAQVAQEKITVKAEQAKIFAGVNRDKADPGYSTVIGGDLGEIGAEDSFDEHGALPTLTYKQTADGWQFDTNLHGRFQLTIERKRPAGDWAFLAHVSSMPFTDHEAQVNGTEYHAIYTLGDVRMDNFGPTATIAL